MITYEKGYWLNEDSRTYLERGYLQNGQTPEERIREIAETAERILEKPGFADKLEDYILRGWVSLASPIWSNFGKPKVLPISCNGSYIGDSIQEILRKTSEIGMMTKLGAGTSAYFGDLRPRGTPISTGGSADGPVHYMELLSSTTNIISQGSVRRGHCAVYLPVEHPDVKEFLNLREEGSAIQNLSLGITISDKWLAEMKAGDKEKRKIWVRIIQKRFESGYPFIFFSDNINNNKPDVYKDKGIDIKASNMCTEIALSSLIDESFVCCLASENLLHFDDFRDTDLTATIVHLLDAVMSEYIEKTEGIYGMEDARRFAINQRAIGIGTLGWHSYLQSKMIPFASTEAKLKNVIIHKLIAEQALEASQEMSKVYGEPPLLKGYGRRHVTLMAIAPTTSSSFILGQVSPSIEPLSDNYFTKDLQKGKFTYKNPYLEQLLITKGKNTKEVWRSILEIGGSVRNLDFLSELEKEVFATFDEIPQVEIIIQAGARQKFIDQAQSINLKIHPDASVNDVSKLMLLAHELGVKTLYYQRSTNPSQELSRDLLSCSSCEA